MTTFLKVAYTVIICLFVLYVAVQVDSRTFFYPLKFYSLFYS